MPTVNIDLTEFQQIQKDLKDSLEREEYLKSIQKKVIHEYKSYTGNIRMSASSIQSLISSVNYGGYDRFSSYTDLNLDRLISMGYARVDLSFDEKNSTKEYVNLDTVKEEIIVIEKAKVQKELDKAISESIEATKVAAMAESDYKIKFDKEAKDFKEEAKKLEKNYLNTLDNIDKKSNKVIEEFKKENNTEALENKYYSMKIHFDEELIKLKTELASERTKSWWTKLLEKLFGI